MALSLKDRVRAATNPTVEQTVEATVTRSVEVPQQSTGEQLHTSAQSEGDSVADIAMGWLEQYTEDITKALPRCVDTADFLTAVRALLPGLIRCTPASLFQATLACARFGLVPDGYHAVIVREGKQAVMIPMAQGYKELMYRSGLVGSIHVGVIYQGDEWNYEPTAPSPLDFTHRPAILASPEERGEPILTYAFAWMNSGARSQVVVLNRHEAEEIRDEHSKAYRRAEESGKRDSYWHTHFLKMWTKSAMLRLPKTVSTSKEVVALLKADEAGDAGQVQIVHAPAPEAQLQEEAEAAHAFAEDSQDPQDGSKRPLPRKRSQPKRTTRLQRRKSSRR